MALRDFARGGCLWVIAAGQQEKHFRFLFEPVSSLLRQVL